MRNRPDRVRLLLLASGDEQVEWTRLLSAPAFEGIRLDVVASVRACQARLNADAVDVVVALADQLGPEGAEALSSHRDDHSTVPIFIVGPAASPHREARLADPWCEFLDADNLTSAGLAAAIRASVDRRRLRDALTRRRAQLHGSEARFRALIARSADGVAVVDREGRLRFVNPAAERLLGARREGLMDTPFPFPLAIGSVTEIELVGKEGSRVLAEMTVSDTEWEDEPATLVSLRDATERKRVEEALRQSEARLRLLTEQVPAVLWSTDLDLRLTSLGGSGLGSLGLNPEVLIGMPLLEAFECEDDRSPVIRAHRNTLEGESSSYEVVWRGIPHQSHVEPMRDENGAVIGTVGVALDVTARREYETQLAHMANHDSLTGLMNRRRFEEELEHQLRVSLSDPGGALLLVDLDGFKLVNDSLGHRYGDSLLVRLSRSLREQLRRGDMLARLGGDEFAILLPGATAQAAQIAADRLLETLARHSVSLQGQPHSVTGSVGIALYPRHGINSTELLAKADRAMYRAKGQGRNRAHLFDPLDDGDFAPTEGEAWTQRIRESLDQGYFLLHAQPILDLITSEVSRYELLLRMNYRGNSMVQPGSFLNVAERSGLIRDIDRWVVREGLQVAAHLQTQSPAPRPGLIVNLSSRAFGDPELLSLLKEELENSRLDPGRLILEITETAAIADFDEASRFIGTLRDLGCRFSVDDFGAGFSSFSYLKHLPLTYLKIDGMYIENLVHNPVDQHMVRAMVELGRGLGIETIAEWVPDEETVRLLRRLGVGHAQGYYIGAPRALGEWFPSLATAPMEA